jgi:uncharacterized protein YggE
MRTLKVQGRGSVSITPDICVFSMRVAEKRKDYAGCHQALNKRVDGLRDDLVRIGVDAADIKTSDYSVSQDTVYSDTLKKHVSDGYIGRHRLTVEVPLEKDRMNPVFKALAKGDNAASISISFGVSDNESARKRLLRNAVAAARVNAETIADAAGISLGPIASIEYGWSEVRFSDEPDYERGGCYVAAEMCAPDIEPNELNASDTVTLVYEIV